MTALEKLKAFSNRLKQDALTAYFIARDGRAPVLVRLLAVAVAGYALSPIDLIPDFIPVLGYLDELILLPIGIALILRLTPSHITDDCRVQASELSERIVSRGGAVAVVAIWLLCAAAVVYWIVRG